MQEQINEKTVALSVKGTKITGRILARAMQEFIRKARASPKEKIGKQSIKSLSKNGASLSNIEITGNNIGDFKKTARKYNVSFALKRDNSEKNPKWVVFFKAKDTDSLTAAFNEYTKKALKVKNRKPSILTKLQKFRAIAKSRQAPVKNKNRGEREI